MKSVPGKHVVAIYLRYFLSPSETFVYRQLQGISSIYDPIVLTAFVLHPDLYPVERLYAKPKGMIGRVYARLIGIAANRFSVTTPVQRRYWSVKLREHRARLVHAHFGHFGMDVLGIARGLDIPLLVTFHGTDASRLLGDSRYTRGLAELFEYAHVITISKNMADRLAGYGLRESRLNVHYIGVPVDMFDFVRRDPVVDKIARGETVQFLQVSNFVEKKGHVYTVDAFARHLARFPDHRLVLAGDGPLRGAIEARCRDRGIERSVTFTGRVVKNEVTALMRDADVFLHHSVTASSGDMEGIPTVVMEAMSMGLVVISTFHSGIPELIDNGVDGYLINERDVDAYVEALDGLNGADPAIPKKAREKIEAKFNMSVQNAKLAEIYQRVIDG